MAEPHRLFPTHSLLESPGVEGGLTREAGLYRRTWAIELSAEWLMPCSEGNGANEGHLPRKKGKQAENGGETGNGGCQGERATVGKAAKQARGRLPQQHALLSPGMGHGVARTHACMELDRTRGRRDRVGPMASTQTSDTYGDETRSFNRGLAGEHLGWEDTPPASSSVSGRHGFPLSYRGIRTKHGRWDVLEGEDEAGR